jgi:hypothetical protein
MRSNELLKQILQTSFIEKNDLKPGREVAAAGIENGRIQK